MTEKKSSVWSKLASSFRKGILKDDEADLSEKERIDIEKALRERKIELIAQKRMRDLEAKYAPKEKTKAIDAFNKIKEYREKNLARTQGRIKNAEFKKQKFKEMENRRYNNVSRPKSYSSSIGERCRELERQREERVSKSKYGY